MKIKRILAGIMAFVLSLNLVQINVNAEENSIENNNEEKVIIVKAEDGAEEASESGILTKILMLFGKGVVSVVKIAGYGVFYVIKITGGLVFSVVKEVFMRTLTSLVIVGLLVGFVYYNLKDSEIIKKTID